MSICRGDEVEIDADANIANNIRKLLSVAKREGSAVAYQGRAGPRGALTAYGPYGPYEPYFTEPGHRVYDGATYPRYPQQPWYYPYPTYSRRPQQPWSYPTYPHPYPGYPQHPYPRVQPQPPFYPEDIVPRRPEPKSPIYARPATKVAEDGLPAAGPALFARNPTYDVYPHPRDRPPAPEDCEEICGTPIMMSSRSVIMNPSTTYPCNEAYTSPYSYGYGYGYGTHRLRCAQQKQFCFNPSRLGNIYNGDINLINLVDGDADTHHETGEDCRNICGGATLPQATCGCHGDLYETGFPAIDNWLSITDGGSTVFIGYADHPNLVIQGHIDVALNIIEHRTRQNIRGEAKPINVIFVVTNSAESSQYLRDRFRLSSAQSATIILEHRIDIEHDTNLFSLLCLAETIVKRYAALGNDVTLYLIGLAVLEQHTFYSAHFQEGVQRLYDLAGCYNNGGERSFINHVNIMKMTFYSRYIDDIERRHGVSPPVFVGYSDSLDFEEGEVITIPKTINPQYGNHNAIKVSSRIAREELRSTYIYNNENYGPDEVDMAQQNAFRCDDQEGLQKWVDEYDGLCRESGTPFPKGSARIKKWNEWRPKINEQCINFADLELPLVDRSRY